MTLASSRGLGDCPRSSRSWTTRTLPAFDGMPCLLLVVGAVKEWKEERTKANATVAEAAS